MGDIVRICLVMYGSITGNPSDVIRNEQGAELPSLDDCLSYSTQLHEIWQFIKLFKIIIILKAYR